MGKREFSTKNYAAPFGRYQSGSEAGASNELLVGREEPRANFIELLLRMGRRGAYLVTGRRGVGKTSFVNYCLAEYKEEVFERFLRSSVGRALFWDHAGVMLLSFGIIFLLLMVSEFLEIVALSTGWGKGASPDILFGLVILPLALICIYPLLYARTIFGRIIKFGLQTSESTGRTGVIATLVTMGVAAGVFFVPPFGSPAISMGRIFLVIAVLYLWVQATSFNNRPTSYSWWVPVSIALALTVTPSFLEVISGLPSPRTAQEFYGNLLWGICLFGMGNILRWLHLDELPAAGRHMPLSAKAWHLALGVFLLLSGLFLLVLLCVLTEVHLVTVIATVLSVGLSLPLFWMHHPRKLTHASEKSKAAEHESISFRPQPQLILGVKAVLCIVLSLQLVHPLFDKWTPAQEAAAPSSLRPQLRPPTPLWHISSLSQQEREERTSALNDKKRPQLTTSYRTLNPAVFYGRTEELSWVLGLFLCLAVIFFIEYEWVLRPFISERGDSALDRADPSPWQDQIPGEREDHLRELRSFAHLTLPWMLYDKWLPILTVSVNLGFEKLDHRRVVHAMLAGLRDQYHRAFTAWDSVFANLGRLLALLLIIMLVTLAGDRWFAMPDLDEGSITPGMEWIAQGEYDRICELFQGRQQGPGAANWICKLTWDNSIFHILYYNLLQTKDLDLYRVRERHLLFYVFPYREDTWPPEEAWKKVAAPLPSPPLLERGIHFRVYHTILFALFFLVGRWLLHRLPIFPYQEILTRIDDTMDNLSSRTSVTSTTGSWKPAQWLQGFFMDERVRQTEQDPVDPRTVEFVFLQILQDIQGVAIHLPGGRNQLVSLPTPEITFVLDELDKIGARVGPYEGASSGGAQQAEILNAERRRSMELHKLLADMKNLLSSAPARFIFVGGRNLHDEWLADQTARQPLLTNIFTAEVYLPSLLTDYEESDDRKTLSSRVQIYVHNQLTRARKLFRYSREKRWLPLLALPLDRPEREVYLQCSGKKKEGKASDKGELYRELKIYDSDSAAKPLRQKEKDELIRDFLQFLTYRSMGNPKKLKELVGTFVRPAGRAVDPGVRWHEHFRDCDHVLLFDDTERFRLQLLARVYRHLIVNFEQGLVRRDDKLAASVLYLTDFLFKFHRRAFSWSNLERVDELVHIHRAPDLREILEAIVAQWSERFLHPIRNGMYDFRFRSDVAREIAYVSRQSAEEMAAFNFTLDESQVLKSAYEVNIARLREGNGKELQDLVAGLGELHEFDQEYDTARFYYRRAISLLDEELEEVMGGCAPSEPSSRIADCAPSEPSSRIAIISGVPSGQERARHYMTWGIARLRLMLQIGMSFEHSRNLERAEMEYQNARTLAQSLLIAMLDDAGRGEAASLGIRQAIGAKGDERLHALKHLNILFQPMFAEVWVAEKLAGGVDTSTSLAENELWKLRNILPFVRERELKVSASGADAQGSNFALIATELHNKTGDLYFFKGRQLVQDIEKSHGLEGYLLAAHYHYAVGLHELRRFIVHRKRSSEKKWVLPAATAHETIASEGWPDFVFRAVGGAFNDLAEALLGRVSLTGFLEGLRKNGLPGEKMEVGKSIKKLAKACTIWLETDKALDGDSSRTGNQELATLDKWLGEWRTAWVGDQKHLLDFSKEDVTATATFMASLQFSLVGARYLKAGGYTEDAGRELLKVCETITHYLWWGLMTQRILGRTEERSASEQAGWDYIFEMAVYALSQAEQLFLRSRRSESFVGQKDEGSDKADSEHKDGIDGKNLSNEEAGTFSRLGQTIPVFAMTLACSLGLVREHWKDKPRSVCRSQDKLRSLLVEWMAEDLCDEDGSKSDSLVVCLRATLKRSLVRHSYPMINRLHTLKLLIDDTLLGSTNDGNASKWTRELIELEGSLSAPLHFTPLHSGVTCALVCILKKDSELRYPAEHRLLSSQEMYTMRRAFYENISDLYYLYDDFNDRQLHFNHAIQMAGTELTAILQVRLAADADSSPAHLET